MPPKATPEDLLLGQIDAVLATRKEKKPPHRDFKARMPLSTVQYVIEAAKIREMSVSAYLRRAGLAFVAHDMNLDLAELLEDEPVTRIRYESPNADRQEGGAGHGKWIIGGLY